MKAFKIFLNTVTILFLVIAGYYYRVELLHIWKNTRNRFLPCQYPITYSIVNFDPRFGSTKDELLNDVKGAEKIWESSVDKNLFEYSDDGTGDLKINFIYDYRQKATDAMGEIGVALNDDRATYDELKNKYDSLQALYNSNKSQLAELTASYNRDKAAYEKDVKYWNSHGGAPKEEYAQLEQRKRSLNNQTANINQLVTSLNASVDTINQAQKALNKLVDTLNLKVSKYNTVGASTGKEFNEGEYVSDIGGTRINIYQFKDENQLIRVLAHEFGHAIGLEHLDNPKAIMYYLNEGINEKITEDDLAALKGLCGIK